MTDNKQTFIDSEFVESKVFDMFYFCMFPYIIGLLYSLQMANHKWK